MKKSKTFERVVEETTAVEEQTPTFVPSYPGEKGLDLDPATIAKLEAEKAATLAGLNVPLQIATPKVEPTAEIAQIVVETDEPVTAEELAAAKAEIERLKTAHEEATRASELNFQTAMSEAMQRLGALETRTARAVDGAAATRLRDAVASMAESEIPGAVRASRASVAEERQAALKRRAARALQIAAQTRALLGRFDNEFGAELNRVSEMRREDVMLGTPNNGRAHAIYGEMRRTLENISDLRSSLANMLATDNVRFDPDTREVSGGFQREIERLFERVLVAWTAEDERNFVSCLHWLSRANADAITTLQLLARGVTNALTRLREMQSPVNVAEPTYRPQPLPEPSKTQLAEMGGLPIVGVTGGPFDAPQGRN